MEKPHIAALERQLALIRFWRAPLGQQYGENYAMSLSSKQQNYTGAYHNKTLPDWHADKMDTAETYWAADEMITLVDHAARTYDVDEPLLPTDLPTTTGFVLMEDSRYFIDRRGESLGYRMFTWWVTQEPRRNYITNDISWVDGVEVAFYTDPKDKKDTQLARLGDLKGFPGSLVHIAFWPFDYSVQNLIDGSVEAQKEYEGPLDPRALGDAEQMMKFLKTFWRLIQQRIMSLTGHRADRGAKRRAERSGFLGNTDEIKVITLRRYKEDSQEELHDVEGNIVEWSHRWIVDGHWRNQYYPSIGMHRQIYIAPHIKGPEDRPLLVKDKVFKWSR